jgi:hypothetical protein
MKTLKLFLIKNTSLAQPIFYVTATDIIMAAVKAKATVDEYGNERVVGSVAEIDTPLLELDDKES